MICFFLLLISLGFSQIIQHTPIESSVSNQSINFNVFVDSSEEKVVKVSLMYKNIRQVEYLNKEMVPTGNNNFSCIITDHFSNKLDMNYFFIVEFENGGVVSHRVENPYLVDIIQYEDNYWEELSSDEKINLLVLSPLPNSIINKEDIMIAVSMFSVNHIDVDNIQVFIDNQDFTDKALITEDFISIPDLNLSSGNHIISIKMINKFGIKYLPYSWQFQVKNSEKQTWFNKKINQKLKYWSSYSESYINNSNIEYYDHNLMYDINFEWLKFKSNFKMSSLENIDEQAKNRYSITLKNNNMKLDLGDFYPYLNNYILTGNRVRGFNFNSTYLDYKYLSIAINFLKGELNRPIQGNPLNNSIYISDVDTLNHILTINRDNYTFKRELSALKLTLGLYKKMFWSLNLFKAKDNINSIYAVIPAANIEVDKSFISDFNNEYLNNPINDTTYAISYEDFNLNYDDFIYSIDSIQYLTQDWGGEKPKDNFIIGSELLFNLDEGRTVIHSELNLSMLNENLWNSITEISQLDTLGSDTIQDGLFLGDSLSQAEKILEYNDIFQLGFDQVPYSPIDIQSENMLKALFNMPSAIYEFDSKFNYGNHSIKYIYEKIGPEFNSLGNLYTQTNLSKTSFSDRMRFFDNRLYLYVEYVKQKEGLDLTSSNVIKSNVGTFNLSLYPGANLPNINIGFSNQNRFNEISEAYFSEDSTTVSDAREHTYTSNYNISIYDKFLLFKEHDINFSMFISDKKDMLVDEKLLLNNNYYSPRSYNKNLSLGVVTKLNQNWSSNIIYNNSNFNNGNDDIDSLNYYQEQDITSINLSLKYSGISLLEKLRLGFNAIEGNGYQDFIYYNFKLSANHRLLGNLRILWNYDYQIKWISNDGNYRDSIFKMKLMFNL